MKKINDLKSERIELIKKMEVITIGETLTDEQRTEWTGYDIQVKKIDDEIAMAERQEELNKIKAEKKENTIEVNEKKSIGVQFRDFLKEAVDGNGPKKFEVRAEPILASTTSAIINKTVANSVDILTSPGEAFLRQLGVTFFPGLTGNFVLPALVQDTATFPGEDVSTGLANMTPEALTLVARRVTHQQSITRETLAQTSPTIYASIVQNLVNGVWNAIANDVFDTLQTDCVGHFVTLTAAGLTNGDLVNMEASIGGLSIGGGVYVTTPAIKAYLKQKIALGTTAGPAIWSTDNVVNGYPAFGVPAANTNKIYFGDFSRMAIGQWGSLYDIVVDPFSKAAQGEIVLTIVSLVDTGCYNPRALVFSSDASYGL